MRVCVCRTLLTVLLLSVLLLAGCGGQEPTQSPEQLPTEPATLKVAVLPVMDNMLPFHAADQNGFFEQVDVAVELVPVKSAQERDTLMQTG